MGRKENHSYFLVVDLLGSDKTEFDAKLVSGRNHNITQYTHGSVGNSRAYEFGYTLRKDAFRAGRRVRKLIAHENEEHAAVYVRFPNGQTEPVWSHGEEKTSPVIAKPTGNWLTRLKAVVARLTGE